MQLGRSRVAVAGASGYTGAELLRLLAGHPGVEIVAVTADKSSGKPLRSVFPSLASAYPELICESLDVPALAERADIIFFALPHTKSLEPASACLHAGRKVVDLSADYRLKDPELYPAWYQTTHPYPELLNEAVYGLPELYRREIRAARLVASPGCYPTAAVLQMAPLVANGIIDVSSIIVDAKSGVSGAGRSPGLAYHFPEAHEALEAYKVGCHRHLPEIEQELSALAARAAKRRATGDVHVVFTPHLVPMNRGILSTAYGRLLERHDAASLRDLYRDFYKNEPFVRVCEGEDSPNPRHLKGANACHINVYVERGDWAVTVAAIDNLVKGAAGQAIQAMNLMVGLPETQGLLAPGVYP